ncbi:MAG: hypothetical protein HY707_02880 [Ignavibacteriae bacterium]|nr:hypothetical protein [Ignavibacteriota bacterium]
MGSIVAQQLWEKIPVELRVASLGRKTLEIVVKDQNAYLPVDTVFTFLGIKNEFDAEDQRLEGFFKTTDTTYVIDCKTGEASIADKVFRLSSDDFIVSEGRLYLRTGFINNFFGLNFRYKPRRLTVELPLVRDLPAILVRQRQIRLQRQLARREIIPEPEAYIGRRFSFVGTGRLGYNVFSRFSTVNPPRTRYYLTFGSKLLGGDFTARLVGTRARGVDRSDFRAQFRYPFLNTKAVQQIRIGEITTAGLRPTLVTGVEVTNRPLQARYFFSPEVFRGQLEPNVDIEGYDIATGFRYQRTDEEGNYQFEIPLIYGLGNIELRGYDQWGQERVLRYRLNLPTTLIPPGEIEYSLTAGRTSNRSEVAASSGSLQWGVSSGLTLGTKFDYFNLSSVRTKVYPALTATSRLFYGLIVNALVAPSAFSRVGLNWIFPSLSEFTLIGTQFSRNAFFNPARMNNSLELILRQPLIRGLWANAFASQTGFENDVLRELQGAILYRSRAVNPSLSSQITWRINPDGSLVTLSNQSIASLGVFMPAGVVLQMETGYNHLHHRIESFEANVARGFAAGLTVQLSYRRIPVVQFYHVGIQIRYRLPYLRVQAGAANTGHGQYEYSTGATGTISFDPTTPYLYFNNRIDLPGHGGIVINPFYDANGNGIPDKGEETLEKSRIFLANFTRQTQSTAIPITSLRLGRLLNYEEYDVYVDMKTLENPLLVPERGSVRVLAEPNYLKRVDIPLVIGGIVRGAVVTKDGREDPAPGINVIMKSREEKMVRKYATSTFSTGEYEFSTVPPGKYRIALDEAQLELLGYSAQPVSYEIDVMAKPEGDVIENKNFILTPR